MCLSNWRPSVPCASAADTASAKTSPTVIARRLDAPGVRVTVVIARGIDAPGARVAVVIARGIDALRGRAGATVAPAPVTLRLAARTSASLRQRDAPVTDGRAAAHLVEIDAARLAPAAIVASVPGDRVLARCETRGHDASHETAARVVHEQLHIAPPRQHEANARRWIERIRCGAEQARMERRRGLDQRLAQHLRLA